MAHDGPPSLVDIEAAVLLLDGKVLRTPLFIAPGLGVAGGNNVAIKAEHAQRTGSFKFRGATNKLGLLSAHQLETGVVTASSGNHGIAVSMAAANLDIGCTVVVPVGASEAKLARIREAGAEVVVVESSDALVAEKHAAELAEHRGLSYVSPYDDPAIVAGQGTVALEILEQAPALGWETVDAIVVAVGGGGLISGIAIACEGTGTSIIGAQPSNDSAMSSSVAAGKIVSVEALSTLSDGTAGGIDPDTITFATCRDLVDEWCLVVEEEIAGAIRHMIDHYGVLIEGAAGVAIAAGARYSKQHPEQRVVVVSCGGNISSVTLERALGLNGAL